MTPALRHLDHHLSDPDEFGIAVSGARLVADFLQPQRRATHVEQFQTRDWALDFHEAHVTARVLGPLPCGWASLGLMRSPAPSSWYGAPAGQGVLVCTPPGEPIDGRITPGFTCMAVSVAPVLWERCRQFAGAGHQEFGGAVLHPLPQPFFTRIERRLRTVRERLRAAAMTTDLLPAAMRDATGFVTQIGTLAWESGVPVTPRRLSQQNRARLARRAEAWMRDHLGEPAQVPEVCQALQVSRRELEYAFRFTFDESPRDYFHALRLNAIRRTLQHADASRETVIRVAHDHGITHLGRFAAHYRALFGENPGMTLQR